MTISEFKIKLILFQRDFFERQRKVFNNINFIIRNKINYLPFKDLLEILEYDILRSNKTSFSITDGSEFVIIPRNGDIARREGVFFRIDPLVMFKNERYISLRSINRIFNVDLCFNNKTRRVIVRQPGRFLITLRGDTLKSLSKLLNTSVQSILILNKNLREPLAAGIKIKIPPFLSMQKKNIVVK